MTVTLEDVNVALERIADLCPLNTSGADDDDETIEDWWKGLQHYSIDDLDRAARSWSERFNRWPTRLEFAAEVAEASGRNRRADAIRRGLAHPHPDTVCPECGLRPNDIRAVHHVEETDDKGIVRARPCSLCETDLYRRFLDGHYPTHGPGECDDPTCQSKGRRRR